LFSPAEIDIKLRNKNIRNSTNYVNFLDSRFVLSCYIGDQDDLKRYLSEYRLNSDFHPYVEFSTDINDFTPYFDSDTEFLKADFVEKKKWFGQFIDKVRRNNSLMKHIEWTGVSPEAQEAWLDSYQNFYKVSTYLILHARGGGNLFQLLIVNYDCMKILPEHPALYFLEDQYLTTIKKDLRSQRAANSAMQYIEWMLKQRPELGAAWLLKSLSMQLFDNIPEAMSTAEKAVQFGPYSVHAQSNLGIMLMRTGEVDKAIACFNEGIHLKPSDPSSYYNLGLAFAKLERFDDAVSQFVTVLQLQPDNVNAHCRLGDIYAMQGQKEKAADEFRKALHINPEYREAKSKLNKVLTQ
jgi:tetratricopeptide (TPR) repeat protein